MLIRRKLIERRAAELLKDCNQVSAPTALNAITDKLRVTVVFDDDVSDEVSGFLLLDEGRAIIGVNENHSEARQRFTIAHEIGHLLLHKPTDGVPHVDKAFHIKFRNSKSSKGQYLEEMEANLFAAELLMPSAALEKAIAKFATFDMDNDLHIRSVAATFKVSQQALIIRLANLGYIKL